MDLALSLGKDPLTYLVAVMSLRGGFLWGAVGIVQ